ncbi:MAG: epoxyqueuosine reductase [Clostridia bacterium]|jgi:epoxyqueuosine reductase QueG|nr:epoxyqueuosine reductase [Clostridia bacterium]
MLEELVKLSEDFVKNTPLNLIKELDNLQLWETKVLVGVAAADDPIFEEYKNPDIIGPHHISPKEWLPEAQSVISFFLHYSDRVRTSNYDPDYPSKEWLYGRIEGDYVNIALRKHLVDALVAAGEKAVAPSDETHWKRLGFNSNWSERHAAYAAGLGTFSLTRHLITKNGCAGRYGSIITSALIKPTPRPYTDPFAYCSKCGACIPRCPMKAVSEKGKEQQPCFHMVHEYVQSREDPRFGCGKCSVNVPCESSAPGL